MKRTFFSFVIAAIFIALAPSQALAKKSSEIELQRDAFRAIVTFQNQLDSGPGFTGMAEWNINRLKYPVEQALKANPDPKTKEALEHGLRRVTYNIWRNYAQVNVDWLESFIDPKINDISSDWIIGEATYYVNEADKNNVNVSDLRERLNRLYIPAYLVLAQRILTRLETENYDGWDVDALYKKADTTIGKAIEFGTPEKDVADLRKRFVATVMKRKTDPTAPKPAK
jgi:hypothetical protein